MTDLRVLGRPAALSLLSHQFLVTILRLAETPTYTIKLVILIFKPRGQNVCILYFNFNFKMNVNNTFICTEW